MPSQHAHYPTAPFGMLQHAPRASTYSGPLGAAGSETCAQVKANVEKWRKRAAYKAPRAWAYPHAKENYAYWLARAGDCGGAGLDLTGGNMLEDTGLVPEGGNQYLPQAAGAAATWWPLAALGLGVLVLGGAVVSAKRKKAKAAKRTNPYHRRRRARR